MRREIRTNPETMSPVTHSRQWTQEDQAIQNDLGHVAFMAWLIEVRDRRDAQTFASLTRFPMDGQQRRTLVEMHARIR